MQKIIITVDEESSPLEAVNEVARMIALGNTSGIDPTFEINDEELIIEEE